MQKRDFETYQKRFRDFEILPKFSETHVFRGTIRHPGNYRDLNQRELLTKFPRESQTNAFNSFICRQQ